jgi:hypothetical protein
MMSLPRSRPTVANLFRAFPSKTVKLTLVRRNGVKDQYNLSQPKFSTCQELNEVFLGGVRTINAGSVGDDSTISPTPSAYVYSLNSSLDFDQDGIACER